MSYMDTPHVLIDWDDVSRCVVLAWRDSAAGGADYRGALNKVLEVLRMKGATKLLIDARAMRAFAPADQDWLTKDWLPRSQRLGLRHSAVVSPKGAVGQMSLSRVANLGSSTASRLHSSASVGAAYFETIEQAKAWLGSFPDR